jgi:MFS transporter, DHA1 family, multidrug resistance protein
LGVFNFSLTSLVSVLFVSLNTNTTYDVGAIIALLFFISLSALLFITRPWKVPDLRRG